MFLDCMSKSREKSTCNIGFIFGKKPELIAEKVNRLLLNGKIFLRGIENPNFKIRNSKHNETNWEMELRKVNRQKGVPTNSKKINGNKKDGNKNRSAMLMYPGVKPYRPVGYAIISPNLDDIKGVTYDMDNFITGCGKKNSAHEYVPSDNIIQSSLPNNEKLKKLLDYIKSPKFNKFEINEVMMDIRVKNLNFIYYTHDSQFENALNMQTIANKKLGKEIPIFKYCNDTCRFIEMLD